MTQPAQQTIELPRPTFPMITRMVSNEILSDNPQAPMKTETWQFGEDHPLDQKIRVVRMHFVEGGVEVYSVSKDGRGTIRNLVPSAMIRFVEESMPIEVFVQELEDAEEANASRGDDDDDEPEGYEPEDPQEASTTTSNGQPTT